MSTIRKIAEDAARLHAESPEVRAAGGPSSDDADDWPRAALLRDLREAGLSGDRVEELREAIRAALEAFAD